MCIGVSSTTITMILEYRYMIPSDRYHCDFGDVGFVSLVMYVGFVVVIISDSFVYVYIVTVPNIRPDTNGNGG